MRISDWSSDVCSSDLLGLQAEVAARRQALPGAEAVEHDRLRGIGGAGDLVNIRHGVHRALLSMPASGVRGCPGGGALRCRPCRSRLLTACSQQYRGSLPAVFPCCPHARSEENQSELRSLMRFSEVGVIWKKKKEIDLTK